MPASKGAEVLPTGTHLVFQALVAWDDFLSVRELAELTSLPKNLVNASLHWLKAMKAVEGVVVEGRIFWFATPESDCRTKVVEEKRKEDEPRRKRRGRVVRVATVEEALKGWEEREAAQGAVPQSAAINGK